MSYQIDRAVAVGLGKYARALDSRDWSLLAEVFADNAVARYGPNSQLRGIEEIVFGVRHYLDGCGPTQHMIGNIEVAVHHGSITSRSYVRAVHRARTGDALLWSFGEYHAQWVRHAGQLRIADWEMRVAFNHGDESVFGH